MSKRKADDAWNWHPKCKKPKWPEKDEDWTEEDFRSAWSINTLMLDAKGHKHIGLRPDSEVLIECSRLVQALDLANFDDWEIDTPTAWTNIATDREVLVRFVSRS